VLCENLAVVRYRLAIVSTEHIATLVYPIEGPSAKLFTRPAMVGVLGALPDALALHLALSLILWLGMVGVLEEPLQPPLQTTHAALLASRLAALQSSRRAST
jgi:hypothetical protein